MENTTNSKEQEKSKKLIKVLSCEALEERIAPSFGFRSCEHGGHHHHHHH